MGSTSYMSPEQAMGEQNLDGRSDIYSLGCVLYELLVGEPPFVGAARAVLMGHLHATPKPVRTRVHDVPQAVDAALESALAKDPADRPPTARAFIESLEGVRIGCTPETANGAPLMLETTPECSRRPDLSSRRRKGGCLFPWHSSISIASSGSTTTTATK